MKLKNMPSNGVSFSIASQTSWAPGLETEADWLAWADGNPTSAERREPDLSALPANVRRRASAAGKMALKVASACLGVQASIPVVFASRDGECARAVDLLQELAGNVPMSPAAFSLSVHNASAGLLSIARNDHGNNIAIAAGPDTIEHAVIDACGLLADGAPQVLLVAFDSKLPEVFSAYHGGGQAFAWAWLLQPAQSDCIRLTWRAQDKNAAGNVDERADDYADERADDLPVEAAGLQILRFRLRREPSLERRGNGKMWRWSHHA
ncbi:beta-ketoacyl synthase chain length factor [Herbaspirillum sp. RTI4]|uniref:beta-ketoacyl synthase chain length factor n=1 Tax=Herbaspirillum sp. RTI4 TaxID=3048640 RepID=UPI002AB48E23|nr:beta-ketoacyl synthase chain length factor [Herbaspirillum sp. RTI4]MDY7578936.1 beta-ketoacyl synthase chain length factor [Herbaspirillum sp. RTI4]MEA9982025.1 beta-ketoacyl synthase chain length factor [Herbaspirillum sp. RTI4]